MKLDRIDHIGVAVKNLDESVKFYEESIGLKAKGFEVVEEQEASKPAKHDISGSSTGNT